MNSQSLKGVKGAKDWATDHIAALRRGEIVQFRPQGKSMLPLIKPNSLVTLEPVKHGLTYNGILPTSIVLVSFNDNTYMHRVGAISDVGKRWYRIENASGRVNGWATEDMIHGVLTACEPPSD